jgi:hypothetical protein
MKENEVTALLTKTRNYFDFIKSQLESESIHVKPEDISLLNAIDSYLKNVQEDVGKWGRVKSDIHRNVLGTCIVYLQRLDHIAKDYKLLSNNK